MGYIFVQDSKSLITTSQLADDKFVTNFFKKANTLSH